jgi:hypothetical protein
MSTVALSKTETAVFRAWEGVDADFGYLSFKAVSEDSGVEIHRIRRAVRSIARKGLLQFSKGLWTDEGQLYGSGYGLTEAGREHLNRLFQARQINNEIIERETI